MRGGLYLESLDSLFRQELVPHRLDVAQHPKLGDRLAVGLEERRPAPADVAAGRFDAEHFAAVAAVKAHSRRGAVLRCDQFLDGAGEMFQRRVHRTQVSDKTARSAQLRTERGAE